MQSDSATAHPTPVDPPESHGEPVFIARQPIFESKRQQVYGYELLFRSSEENRYTCADGRHASSETINRAMNSIGLEAVVGEKKAFINFTRDLLLEELYCLLPPKQCVVEILEDVIVDEEVVVACRKLRAAGYELALDDITDVARILPLAEHADIIKIDLPNILRENRASVLRSLAPFAGKLLAEKVETKEDYEQAVALGCHYVQGYFFCKPEMMRGKGLTGAEAVYLRFLRDLNRPTLDFKALEDLIKQDVSLAYKLFRYLNSASMGFRHKVTSIRQALVMLGERSLRKWGSLVAITSLKSRKPPELMLTSLVRARFCESIALKQNLVDQQLDMFLVGLLSSLDAMLGVSMAEVLEQTCVAPDVRNVLCNDASAPKELSRILALALACERGAWATVSKTSAALRLTQGEVAKIYYDSLTWATQAFNVTVGPDK